MKLLLLYLIINNDEITSPLPQKNATQTKQDKLITKHQPAIS